MPRIIKQGDLSSGHCWPPTAPIPLAALQKNVYAHGLPIICVGDNYMPHPGPCGNVPPHPVGTILGSPNVFIGGMPILRDGDPLSCGDIANTLNGTVFCNGGGIGPSENQDPNQSFGFSVSLPFIGYQNTSLSYRLVDPTGGGNPIFRGCNSELIPTIYTKVTEEYNGRDYFNYPGPPLTVLAGAQGIPSYANELIRNPIPILDLKYRISTNGSFFTDVIGDSLGDGIKINKNTGVIFGSPEQYFEIKTLEITIRNFVGEKKFNVNLTLAESANCS